MREKIPLASQSHGKPKPILIDHPSAKNQIIRLVKIGVANLLIHLTLLVTILLITPNVEIKTEDDFVIGTSDEIIIIFLIATFLGTFVTRFSNPQSEGEILDFTPSRSDTSR
ncbi:MAG: hypothetical protein HeimC2_10840 [Candidatus Heimdallarchaeota archaeon LC_2]|nr:MAG: hypothetical protein HeimC2_10840 [Candidatus Heimdallarchaeota archaeon LC_2]